MEKIKILRLKKQNDHDNLVSKSKKITKDYKDDNDLKKWPPLHRNILLKNITEVRNMLLCGEDPNAVDQKNLTPFFYALEVDDEEIVALLLEFGAKANNTFEIGYNKISYLQKAVTENKVEIVKLLLDHGCNVNDEFPLKNIDHPPGSRPLLLAAALGKPEIVKLLLSYNAEVNIADLEGETPLHKACEADNLEVVRILLKNNALINVRTRNYSTPLYKCVKKKNYKIIELLIENGVLLESENCETIMYFYILLEEAIKDGHGMIIEKFLQIGLDPNIVFYSVHNKIGWTLLHSAVDQEQVEIIHVLFERNADVAIKDDQGRLPLHYAARYGNIQLIHKLLEHEGDRKFSTVLAVDKVYSTPLHEAIKSKNIDCIQTFIALKSDLGAQTLNLDTPLHIACQLENIDAVKILLKNKAPLNLFDIEGNTPLHIAVNLRNYEIVKLLLKGGANTIIENNENQTPLFLALQKFDEKCVNLLFQYSDNINQKYYQELFCKVLKYPEKKNFRLAEIFLNYGFIINWWDNKKVSKLFYAVINNKENIVDGLLYLGVDVDVIIGGQTLLHLACACGHHEIVKILFKHNANIYIKNSTGKLPLYYACLSQSEDIINIFVQARLDLHSYPEAFHYPIYVFMITNSKRDSFFFKKIICTIHSLGADCNYVDEKGQNALHLIFSYLHTCLNNSPVQVKHFYPKDAITYQNVIKNYICVGQEIYIAHEIIGLLVSLKIDINAKTFHKNEGVIHMAVKICNTREPLSYTLINYLLNCPELYLESRNKDGHTAMDLACNKNINLLFKLVKYGADIRMIYKRVLQNCYRYFDPRYYKKQNKMVIIPYELVFYDPEDHINEFGKYYQHFNDTYLDVNVLVEKEINVHIDFHDLQTRGRYRRISSEFSEHDEFEKECMKELERLKEIKINNKDTIVDFLMKSKNRKYMIRLARNENIILKIKKVIENLDDFPYYGKILFRRFQNAVWHKNLIECAEDSLTLLLPIRLPSICLENIVDNLKNQDLEKLCKILPENMKYYESFTNEMREIENNHKDVKWSDLLQFVIPKKKCLKQYWDDSIWSDTLDALGSVICAYKVLGTINGEFDFSSPDDFSEIETDYDKLHKSYHDESNNT